VLLLAENVHIIYVKSHRGHLNEQFVTATYDASDHFNSAWCYMCVIVRSRHMDSCWHATLL